MLTIKNIFVSCLLGTILLLGGAQTVGSQVDQHASESDTLNVTSDGWRSQLQKGRFSIRVGAFKEIERVQVELPRLIGKGKNPFYRHEDTNGKGKWYRVYVGSYETRQEARQAAEQLKKDRIVAAYLIWELDDHGDYFFADDRQQATHPRVDHSQAESRTPGQDYQSDPTTDNGEMLQMEENASVSRQPEQQAATSDQDAVRLSLLDAIRYSLEGNREIKVVSYTPQQAMEDVKNAESVYDASLFVDASYRREPNLDSSVLDIVTEDDGLTKTGVRKPLKTGGSMSLYLQTQYSELNNATFERSYKHIIAPSLEIRQPLLNNIGAKKEETAIKIANYQANISEEEFRQKVIEIANNVSKVYWRLFLFKELIDIDQQNLHMAEEVHRREDVRLARGISQQLDVARARSKAQSRHARLLRSRVEYRIAMDRLKLLLNWSDVTIDSDLELLPIEAPQTVPVDVDEKAAIETALSHRPEVMKAKNELSIRQVDEALSAHQRLPNLDAFGRYNLSGYGDDFDRARQDISLNDEDAWEVGINFEWAFGNRSANATYRKKRLKRLQSNAQLERLEDDIKLDVKQVLHEMASAKAEIEATRSAKEAAEKVVEGEFVRYDIDQAGNEELLRAQDLLALTRRSFVQAIVQYNVALNELARAQGNLPNGVAIDEARR